MTSEVKNEILKLRKLKQYQDTPDSILEKQAQKNIILRELASSGNFIDDSEKKQAKLCFEKYLEANEFDNFSDLSTLSMLVFNEILISRIQKTINESTTKEGKSYISDKLLKSLHEAEDQVLSLKSKLGIDKDKTVDEFTVLQNLKKNFHKWIQENKASCTIAVPYKCVKCNHEDVKLCLLRKRVSDWDAIDHPAFLGRFYYSKHGIDMVEEGTLSKEDYAKIFSVSVEYVEWAIKNRGRILSSKADD